MRFALIFTLTLFVSSFAHAGVFELVADVAPGASRSSEPRSFGTYQGDLYFSGNEDGRRGLYRYDTTSVTRVDDLGPSSRQLVELGGYLYYGSGDSLVRFDGVSATAIGGATISGLVDIAALNGSLFFRGRIDDRGFELCTFDGTNVTLVTDLAAGYASSSPEWLTVFDHKLYFSAYTEQTGREIYVFDGETIHPAFTAVPGFGGYGPRILGVWRDELYFAADLNGNYYNLYRYDGVSYSLATPAPLTSDYRMDSATALSDGLYLNDYNGRLLQFDGQEIAEAAKINTGYSGGALLASVFAYRGSIYTTGWAGDVGFELFRYTPPLIGDANGDCEVGAADYALWAAQFGQTGSGLAADFDANGSVGAGDYALWAANFGKTCSPAGASVPEPSTWVLAMVGLVGLWILKRPATGR